MWDGGGNKNEGKFRRELKKGRWGWRRSGEYFGYGRVLGKLQTLSQGNLINKMGEQEEIGYGSTKKLGEGAYEVDYGGLFHLGALQ